MWDEDFGRAGALHSQIKAAHGAFKGEPRAMPAGACQRDGAIQSATAASVAPGAVPANENINDDASAVAGDVDEVAVVKVRITMLMWIFFIRIVANSVWH